MTNEPFMAVLSWPARWGGPRAQRTFNCKSLSVTAELRHAAQQHYQDNRHAYQFTTDPAALELIL